MRSYHDGLTWQKMKRVTAEIDADETRSRRSRDDGGNRDGYERHYIEVYPLTA